MHLSDLIGLAPLAQPSWSCLAQVSHMQSLLVSASWDPLPAAQRQHSVTAGLLWRVPHVQKQEDQLVQQNPQVYWIWCHGLRREVPLQLQRQDHLALCESSLDLPVIPPQMVILCIGSSRMEPAWNKNPAPVVGLDCVVAGCKRRRGCQVFALLG